MDQKKKKKQKGKRWKRFICIFSCALAPSGGFPVQITQLLTLTAENGEDSQLNFQVRLAAFVAALEF